MNNCGFARLRITSIHKERVPVYLIIKMSRKKKTSFSWAQSAREKRTHMAIALGDVEACRRGKAVQFYRANDLVAMLQEKCMSRNTEQIPGKAEEDGFAHSR